MEKDIREKSLMPIEDLLTQSISDKTKHTSPRFYVGKVEDNSDNEKLGRCKVRVYGIYGNEIPTVDLPFATPSFGFVGSLTGNFVVPPIGALVNIFFEQDDIYRPTYTSKVISKNDYDNWTEKNEDYPNSLIIYESDNSDILKINTKSGLQTMRHSSGAKITIDKSGNILIENVNSETGDLTINAKGKISITSESSDISLEANKGHILLGGTAAAVPIPNLQNDIMTGAPTTLARQVPGVLGSTYIRL